VPSTEDERPSSAVVRVVKDQIDGCTGEVPMRWNPDFGAFEEPIELERMGRSGGA
jgi:hypothetical protein